MKEQGKAMARDISQTGISNMPDGEFKATIIRILTEIGKRMEDFRKILTTEIKELKKNQSKMKNAIKEIGNRLGTMNRRLDEAE